MATTKLKGQIVNTCGELPKVGEMAPDFTAAKGDLSDVRLSDFRGQRVIINVFPSIDTGVCAQSVRTFNKEAANLENTQVLCVSKDLPFAQQRFCGAEGLENVTTLSVFRDDSFSKGYGVELKDSGMRGLLARSVFVLDEEGKLIYEELIPEITTEPNYQAVLDALK